MVNLVCYNLKATNVYIFNFNQNQNFFKKRRSKFSNVSVIERAERRTLMHVFLLVKRSLFLGLNVCLVPTLSSSFGIGPCAFFVWHWSMHFVKLFALVLPLTFH